MSYDHLRTGTVFRSAHFLRRWLLGRTPAPMAEDWRVILPQKHSAQDCIYKHTEGSFHIRPERGSDRSLQTETSWATRLGFCHKSGNAVNEAGARRSERRKAKSDRLQTGVAELSRPSGRSPFTFHLSPFTFRRSLQCVTTARSRSGTSSPRGHNGWVQAPEAVAATGS